VQEPEGSSALFRRGSREIHSGSSALALEHLQMNPLVTGSLHAAGLRTIADVLEFVRSPQYPSFRYRLQMRDTLTALAQATKGNSTDWLMFWNLTGENFCQLAADLPELRRLSAKARQHPVDRTTFGNAGAMLQQAGYDKLGKLADALHTGIPEVRGIGPGKIQEFFARLVSFVDRIDTAGEVIPDENSAGNLLTASTMDLRFPASVNRLSTGILHLGTKSKWLREAGLLTVGQIADAWPIRQGDLHGLGPSTLRSLEERLATLMSATSEAGEVDWDSYCHSCGIPLVPSIVHATTGAEFLNTLAAALTEIADHLPDNVYAEILRSRLSKPPGEQKTLEEIAQSTIPAITRERVRQKEKRLLRQLAGGLMWDSYSGLGIHFRSSFSHWWRIAAAEFRDTEDIGFDEFVSTLAEAWKVDVPTLTGQLPIILAIVTGEPQMPVGFRSAIRIDPALYGVLRIEVRDLSLSRLRVGKYVRQLEEQGISTLGDLISMFRSGAISDSESVATRSAKAQLDILAGCLDTTGAVIWSSYRAALGLEVLPATITTSADQFVQELPSVTERFLQHSAISRRAAEIFRLRTSQPASQRLTLEKTSEALQTHGPSVKREETLLLQHLNDVIVGKEYAYSPVWLDESWLSYWAEAAAIFSASEGDFQAFERDLQSRWELTHADRAIVTLWAVFSGYPNGRPSSRRKIAVASENVPQPVGRIRLRGFRRVH